VRGLTTSRSARLLLLAAILGAGLAVLGAAANTDAALIPAQVNLPAHPNAPQYLQVDAKGNVFLLRGDTLDVYTIDRDQVGKPKRLETTMPPDKPTAAAMSRDASSWALVASNRVFHFVDGSLQSTPDVGWLVTSVALLRGTPVAGVLPMTVGQPPLDRPPAPPLVMQLKDSTWDTLIPGKLPQRSQAHDPMDVLFADHTVKLTSDEKGRLWATYPYKGRLVRFTATGKPDAVIVLGKGTVRYPADEAERGKAVREDLHKRGYTSNQATAGAFTAQLALRGLAFGQDGTLYTLLSSSITGGKTALGRLNPATASFETTPIELPGSGELSMAAGREGLYLATVEGRADVWRVSWPTLDAATWTEFAEARVSSSLGPSSAGTQ